MWNIVSIPLCGQLHDVVVVYALGTLLIYTSAKFRALPNVSWVVHLLPLCVKALQEAVKVGAKVLPAIGGSKLDTHRITDNNCQTTKRTLFNQTLHSIVR